MALVNLQAVRISFGGPLILDGVSCQIEPGDRIGLLGRNGAGKSTLLNLLDGVIEPDSGAIRCEDHTKIALLPQGVPQDIEGTVNSVVAQGLGRVLVGEEAAWESDHRVAQIVTRMDLDGGARFETLSSGMKRRSLLARSLVQAPDLLLLDEPTNHLDIPAIQWLEDFLAKWQGTLLFVTHDRVFLAKLARRILEIDRGRLLDWTCDYPTFLERKEAAQLEEEKRDERLDRKLAEEEVWIRRGIRARRTRDEGRVRALEALRRVRSERRDREGRVRMKIQESNRSGDLVAEAKGVSFSFGEQDVIRKFSSTILRGDKVGIIGPNGAGKTTLINLLLGRLKPTRGSLKLGTRLQIAYFDQLRQELVESMTIAENVAPGKEFVQIGERSRHIYGYLQDFLFTPDRSRTLVNRLSGGERNRVLLARLLAQPANLLVLDEPTNDLDAETLEILEERLVDFGGTLLIVSHDRAFLNNVVTSTLSFDEDGINEYVGGYDDWLRQRADSDRASSNSGSKIDGSGIESGSGSRKKRRSRSESDAVSRRLSFQERRDFAALPARIEEIEARIASSHERMADPEFYKRTGEEVARERTLVESLETELEQAYATWQDLDDRYDPSRDG